MSPPGIKLIVSNFSPIGLTIGYSSTVPSYNNWLPVAVIVSVSDVTFSNVRSWVNVNVFPPAAANVNLGTV